jgi:signal transduction histidine kinase/ActR/RegA family two-component response regulator
LVTIMKHPPENDPISLADGKRLGQSRPFDPPQEFFDSSSAVLFDTSHEALLVVDSSGALQRANPRARELLRIRNEAISHKSLEQLLRGPSAKDLSAVWALQDPPQPLDAFLPTGFPIRVTLRSILPATKHLLLCLEDGSIVQRAEAKWQKADANLRSVLDAVREGIILFDPLGEICLSNARFRELFGLASRDVEEARNADGLAELLSKRFRDPAAFAAPWRSYIEGNGKPSHDELEMLRPMQRVLHRFSRPVLDSSGRSSGWLAAYSEITEERQAHPAVGHTEKMAALGQLVSGIAHELNNPLTTISGYTQLLLGRGLPAACIPDARKLYQEAERARRIVKDLLYFARESKPERLPVDVNEIIERTLALRSYELKVANISVNSDLAPDLPRTMADPYQIQQVILNLIINSEQALTEQRGKGNIRIRTSHLKEQPSETKIVIEFSDDGPGIAPELVSRIFDPFFTTKAPGIGTGLGLSIVYGIVRQHQGDVTLESPRGEGAKFLIKLPVVPVSSEALHDGHVATAGTFRHTGPKRILVLEDEPTVSQLIADVLREDQHEVESVPNGQAGLARISTNTYDLVICDLRMPRLDGRAVYEALVRAGSSIQNRILFITGDTLAPRTFEFFEKNYLRYLAKPFLVEELKMAVYQVLDAEDKTTAVPANDDRGQKGASR